MDSHADSVKTYQTTALTGRQSDSMMLVSMPFNDECIGEEYDE